jgi:hypothetical protein
MSRTAVHTQRYYRRARAYVDQLIKENGRAMYLWHPAWDWYEDQEILDLSRKGYLRYSNRVLDDASDQGRRPVPTVYRIGALNSRTHTRRFFNEGNAWRTAVGQKAKAGRRGADRIASRKAVVHTNTVARQRGRIEDLGLDRYDWHKQHRPMSHYRWYWD